MDADSSPSFSHQLAQFFYRTQFGGCLDQAAMLSMSLPHVLASPYFATSSGLPAAATAFGGYWMADRFLKAWSEQPFFPTNVHIASSASPAPVSGGAAPTDAILLGYTVDTGKPIWIPYNDPKIGGLTQHILGVGATGVGKTVMGFNILAQHIQQGGGILWIDGKLAFENYEMLKQLAIRCGRERDLLVINPGDPTRSNTYNPCCFGDPDEIADRYIGLIPSTETNAGADHYKQQVKTALNILIEAVQSTGRAFNSLDLAILMQSPRAMKYLDSIMQDGNPRRQLQMLMEGFRGADGNIDIKKMKDTFLGMAGRLFTFGSGRFGQVTNSYTPDVRLLDAMLSRKLVLLQLPTMNKDLSATNFAKLMMGDLRTASAHVQALPKEERPWPPTLGWFDEAGSYISTSWNRMFEQLRDAHVILAPYAQTLANFTAITDELGQMIMGNTRLKLFFELGTQESAAEVADLIGKYRGVMRSMASSGSTSESVNSLRMAPEAGIGNVSGQTFTEREEEMHLVTPDDLKKLGRGNCIATFGGASIFHLRIPQIQISEEIVEMAKALPLNRFAHEEPAGLNLFRRYDDFVDRREREANASMAEH